MCIEPGDELNLGCLVSLDVAPRPIPVPIRTWTKDGVVIYSTQAGTSVETDNFTNTNPIFTPGLFNPDVLVTPPDGNIQYQTTFSNTTAPQILDMIGITEDEARVQVLNFALGTWNCTTTNTLGTDSIQVIIRMCGKLMSCFTV